MRLCRARPSLRYTSHCVVGGFGTTFLGGSWILLVHSIPTFLRMSAWGGLACFDYFVSAKIRNNTLTTVSPLFSRVYFAFRSSRCSSTFEANNTSCQFASTLLTFSARLPPSLVWRRSRHILVVILWPIVRAQGLMDKHLPRLLFVNLCRPSLSINEASSSMSPHRQVRSLARAIDITCVLGRVTSNVLFWPGHSA